MLKSWTELQIGDLCRLVKGTSPTQKTLPGEYPLIVTAAQALTSDSYQIDDEAVCVPMVSSTGHGHASLKRVHYARGKFAVANIIVACVVKDKSLCDTRYLWLYLQARKDEILVPRMQGTANVSLSQRELAKVPVVLPSLREQRRIVDLIDALDEAIHAADGNTQCADSVYSAIRDAAFSSMVGDSVPLGQLATTRLGKMLSASLLSREAEAPYVRNANVQWNRLELDDLKTMPFSESDRIEFDLRCGDVLVCEGGEIGRALVLREDLPGVHFQKAIHRVRCGPNLHPDFLQACLWYLASTGGLDDYSSGSTIAHLTGEKLRRLPIPIIRMEEQEALVAILNECLSAQASSADHATSLRTLRTNLLAALLSGEHEIPSSYDEHLGVVE